MSINWCQATPIFISLRRTLKMKKGKLLTLLPLMAMTLTGCMNNNSNKKSFSFDSEKVHNIGICQLVAHPALDKATEGFMKAVEDGLGKDKVKFDLQEAAGESATCATICNSFVSKKVDLIMANATPALQAAANSTLDIPILGTSVTEYGVALSIDNFDGTVGGNISGTSDLAPLTEQADMVKAFVPNAQNVGLLFCSAEANSLYQVKVVEECLQKQNITTKRISFADSNDLSAVLSGNIAGLDALYIPTDNKCADNTDIIDAICRPAGLPIICGEESLCAGCGVATLSIDYFALGVKTDEMALEILKEGKDISTMPIAYDTNPTKKFNKAICDDLGITAPDGYVEIAVAA